MARLVPVASAANVPGVVAELLEARRGVRRGRTSVRSMIERSPRVSFVLDASATMAWCFEDVATPGTDALLAGLENESALVPALWQWEVANVLLMAERKGRMSQSQPTASWRCSASCRSRWRG